ncbi:hypothetical protein G6F46_014724 [Rhizopus delemar]|nr:hypothetical protein G6F46_014724 [Rhizopus delemar]
MPAICPRRSTMAVATVATGAALISRMNGKRSVISIAAQSAMDLPWILHERMVGLSRVPPQSEHGWRVITRASPSRSACVRRLGSCSRYARLKRGMTPWKRAVAGQPGRGSGTAISSA